MRKQIQSAYTFIQRQNIAEPIAEFSFVPLQALSGKATLYVTMRGKGVIFSCYSAIFHLQSQAELLWSFLFCAECIVSRMEDGM